MKQMGVRESEAVHNIDGSCRILFRISFPLMLTFLSMNLMIFFDRLFLSHYSTQALSDAICAGNIAWSLSFPWIVLAGLAEVFVAQYNGKRLYDKLGEPIWQMIWLSICVLCVFYLIAEYGALGLVQIKFLDSSASVSYFKWNCYFTPCLTLFSAISAFYIGQGKTRTVTFLVIAGSLTNICLDYVLIFGVEGSIQPLGLTGAIIASGCGILLQLVVIFFLFLRKKNRECFGTDRWFFNFEMFLKILKLGGPDAILIYVELLGWTVFLWLMKRISSEHVLVVGICQSILQLFLCFGSGLEEGAAAVVGNLLGAEKFNQIERTFRSGLTLIALFSFLISFFLIIYPEFLIRQFTGGDEAEMGSVLKNAFILIAVYLVCESIRWLLKGILIAGGDTLFLMKSGIFCTWFLLVLPIYLFVYLPQASVLLAFWIWILFSIALTLITFFRFMQKRWEHVSIAYVVS